MLRFVYRKLKSITNTVRRYFVFRRLTRICHFDRTTVFGRTSVVRNNRLIADISIGAFTTVLGHLQTHGHGGKIRIGKECFVGQNSYIWSSQKIVIGDRVLISHGVNIHDNNAHPLSASARNQQYLAILNGSHPDDISGIASSPIIIGDDVWIGFNSTVLKGVTIGAGSIIGAGSLILKDVPPLTIVVGNPARIIGAAEL